MSKDKKPRTEPEVSSPFDSGDGGDVSDAPMEDSTSAVEVVREALDQAKFGGLHRRKRKGSMVGPNDPKTFDIKAEADRVAFANGHDMSKWVPAEPGVDDFYHAKCLTCGVTAYARWRRAPQHEGGGLFSDIGGDAIKRTEAETGRKRSLRDDPFEPRSMSPDEVAAIRGN